MLISDTSSDNVTSMWRGLSLKKECWYGIREVWANEDLRRSSGVADDPWLQVTLSERVHCEVLPSRLVLGYWLPRSIVISYATH
jgi:hypothetical protein